MKKKLSFIIEIIIGIIFICFGYFVIDTDYYATLFYAMGFGLAFASGVQLLKICYYEMPKNKEKLQNLLKEFVIKSNYEEFYNSNKEYYKFLIEKFSKSLNYYKEYDSKILSDFYGYSMGKNEIKLFNFVNGSFGYNKKDLVISLNSVNDEKEISNKVINTCIHEFSHSYVNPLGYKYFKDVNIDNLFNEAKSNGLQNSYYDKYSFINEYVVRAVQVYFSEKIMEPDYVLRNIKNHQSIGYIYIEQIKNLFYKKDEYENFELFYKNEIVKYFTNLNDNNIDRIFINKKKR